MLSLSPYHPIQLGWGLIIWSIYFVVMYGGLSIVCASSPPDPEQGPFTWLNVGLLALTIVTGAWSLVQANHCWRAAKRERSIDSNSDAADASDKLTHSRLFITSVSAGVYLAAGVATLAVGAPAAVLAPCI